MGGDRGLPDDACGQAAHHGDGERDQLADRLRSCPVAPVAAWVTARDAWASIANVMWRHQPSHRRPGTGPGPRRLWRSGLLQVRLSSSVAPSGECRPLTSLPVTHPAGTPGVDRAGQHPHRQQRAWSRTAPRRGPGLGAAVPVLGPRRRQVQLTVDEGAPAAVAAKGTPDLAVLDPTRGAGVLPRPSRGLGALPHNAVSSTTGTASVPQGLHHEVAQVVAAPARTT